MLCIPLLLSWISLSSASVLHHFTELQPAYDFIVVGAGPGGSALANRLTESPSVSVLVLEAGGANDGDITIDVPLLCTRLTPRTEYDWNFTTTPQPNLNGRVLPFPRGIGLGGSSAVNCLVYTRGTSDDIDKWARLSADKSWGWDAMLNYFKKSEKFNFPVDKHSVAGQFDPRFHGFSGFIGVSVPGSGRSIDGRVVDTTQQLKEFPFRLDMNSGDHLGVGWVQALVDRGVRSSSKAYFTPEVVARKNLDILLHAQVSRVLSSKHDNVTFNTVEFRSEGKLVTLTAGKEVVLSAGAINTPSILMHSGIGDASSLSKLGIAPRVNLPSVGKNLTDHVGVSSSWTVSSNLTWDTVLRNATLEAEILEQWKESKTGLMVDTSENHAAWLRVPTDTTAFSKFKDPSSGNRSAHYEFLFQNGLSTPQAEGNFINIPTGCVSPASRGAVSINSTDPFAAPLIDPGLLTEDVDLFILREAIRSARRFLTAPAWDGYILTSNNNATTDEELNTYIRNNAVSFFHPVSTAAMSPPGAHWGVVDPDLKVKGVKGLRIVDASVAPSLPAAHTSAAVYAISERAADIIKAAWPKAFLDTE
ncbi:hypothetical protein C8J56DRAFT_813923 [Mycena floridula]|nr:hypothetical protein C8J56DRAFT_813923 [Mycena floridula]